MTTDPSINMVAFRLRSGIVTGQGRTRDDDAVRQAWRQVQHEHGARPDEVTEVYSEWQPSPADLAFLAGELGRPKLTYSFTRPAGGNWDAAFAQARGVVEANQATYAMRRAEEEGELVPVLWSPATMPPAIREAAPARVLVPGVLVATLARARTTERGTIGMSHVTHAGLGNTPFDALFNEAGGTLAGRLRINAHGDGGPFSLAREGGFAASAVALPGFATRMAQIVGTDRLVIAITDADCAFLAAEGSPAAAELARMVAAAPRGGQPEPTLLRAADLS